MIRCADEQAVPLLANVLQVSELTEEQKEYMAQQEAAKLEAAAGSVDTKGPASFFHGKEKEDYQGLCMSEPGLCCIRTHSWHLFRAPLVPTVHC